MMNSIVTAIRIHPHTHEMNSGCQTVAMYEEVAPQALDFARRLTEILTPNDREAFNRAIKQLTARSAELVAELGHEHRDDDE